MDAPAQLVPGILTRISCPTLLRPGALYRIVNRR
jgi:hypothetical protein